MTTPVGTSNSADATGAVRRGLSRRQLIKASAIAGAAAWTAPVIIDSLTSPAAAFSNCVPYFVKVAYQPGGDPHHCPGSGTGYPVTQANGTPSESSVSFDVSGAKWAGAGTPPSDGCTLLTGTSMIPTVAVSGSYLKVTLNPAAGYTCAFAYNTGWQVGARYGTAGPGDRYVKVSGRTTASGYGYYTENGTTAYVQSPYPSDSSRIVQYVYVKFCCDK